MVDFPRASGVLLHPTSLPGRFGIGDFGEGARRFVDFLSDAGQTYWQILPLGPTGYGDSPYQCFSAFAGNTLLVSPEKVVGDGFLEKSDLKNAPSFPAKKVDYGRVLDYKNALLRKAFENFRRTDDQSVADAFHAFCDANGFWLEDYALFRAAKLSLGHAAWQQWEAPLRNREAEALGEARARLDEEAFAQKFYQFLFFKQWGEVKSYCAEKGIKVVGDLPIFVALDSADVWCNPSLFKLREDGSPLVVAGVPPDYFSKTGQLWGNPLYDWEEMRRDRFGWWVARARHLLRMVDVVRIDHFRGFVAAWEVPGGDRTAENGRWVDAPGRELFEALREALGDLPFWAEDLGAMTPEVEDLRDRFGFPGMRILQYGFGGGAKNRDLPHNYVPNSVVYTGTHDNDTVAGWLKARGGLSSAGGSSSSSERSNPELEFCLKYLNVSGGGGGKELHWDFIRAALASVADSAVVPMQDLLGLDNKSRMNLPASAAGNWQWRCRREDFSKEVASRLRDLTEMYGRV